MEGIKLKVKKFMTIMLTGICILGNGAIAFT